VEAQADSAQFGSYEASCNLILGELKTALGAVDPGQVEVLIDALLGARAVFVVGVGRVMLSLQAFAKRLNHIGISTHCVGDINEPAITDEDVLIVASGSGESVVPVAIAEVGKRHGATVIHIGSNPNSALSAFTDIFVRIPVRTKFCLPDELPSQQIMSSLFEQSLYLFGDAVALLIARRQNIDLPGLWRYHANLE
jgi:6-phospho-3-hexuloisomerase